jgi:hypothetical protein
MDDDDIKVLLKFGYNLSLCMSINTASQIMKLLGKENLLKQDSSYKDSVRTEHLKPWGTEEISMSFVSPAKYLQWVAAGDKDV